MGPCTTAAPASSAVAELSAAAASNNSLGVVGDRTHALAQSQYNRSPGMDSSRATVSDQTTEAEAAKDGVVKEEPGAEEQEGEPEADEDEEDEEDSDKMEPVPRLPPGAREAELMLAAGGGHVVRVPALQMQQGVGRERWLAKRLCAQHRLPEPLEPTLLALLQRHIRSQLQVGCKKRRSRLCVRNRLSYTSHTLLDRSALFSSSIFDVQAGEDVPILAAGAAPEEEQLQHSREWADHFFRV